LKILVSVVRFRPGPPRISLTERQPMQVGVFVLGTWNPRLRFISGTGSAVGPAFDLCTDKIAQASANASLPDPYALRTSITSALDDPMKTGEGNSRGSIRIFLTSAAVL
jgi:hypothetical protein